MSDTCGCQNGTGCTCNNGNGVIKEFIPVEKETKVVKPLGFLRDANGDFSSGRFVKIFSFVIAALVAIGCSVFAVIKLMASEAIPQEFINYSIGTVGLFMGAATASEVVQKITGR